MLFIVVIFVMAFSMYVYYKIKYVRSRFPMERKLLSGKSNMSLGVFIFMFGLNQLFFPSSAVRYTVAAIFMLLGLFNIIGGYRSYKHHVPYALIEAEEMNK